MANCSGCPFRWHDTDCEYCSKKNDEVIDLKNYSKETCSYYKEWAESRGKSASTSSSSSSSSGGCYVATCVYGSYDCPPVWTLRRWRDNVLQASWFGKLFVRTYYAVSPTLVKWFGNSRWFKKLLKMPLDRLVLRLRESGIADSAYADQ